MTQSNHIDDSSILGTDILWRGIQRNKFHPNKPAYEYYVYREKTNKWCPSSLAFQVSSDKSGISVFLEKIVREKKRGPQDVINDYAALAALKTSDVRNLDLGVCKAPLPQEPAHANIFSKDKLITGTIRKKLARLAEWVIPPPEMKNES